MTVTWAELGGIVAAMGSMTVIIPWLVKLFVRPEIDKVLRSIDRMFIRHLSEHHTSRNGPMFPGPPRMTYRERKDEDV